MQGSRTGAKLVINANWITLRALAFKAGTSLSFFSHVGQVILYIVDGKKGILGELGLLSYQTTLDVSMGSPTVDAPLKNAKPTTKRKHKATITLFSMQIQENTECVGVMGKLEPV